MTKLRGQDILRSSGVRVEQDQLKFYEKHGILAPTCWYALFVSTQKGQGWGTGYRDLKNYRW